MHSTCACVCVCLEEMNGGVEWTLPSAVEGRREGHRYVCSQVSKPCGSHSPPRAWLLVFGLRLAPVSVCRARLTWFLVGRTGGSRISTRNTGAKPRYLPGLKVTWLIIFLFSAIFICETFPPSLPMRRCQYNRNKRNQTKGTKTPSLGYAPTSIHPSPCQKRQTSRTLPPKKEKNK